MDNLSSDDVLKYLEKLRETKKSLGAFHVSKEDDLYIIFDQNNIPKLTVTQKIYDIFNEIEV